MELKTKKKKRRKLLTIRIEIYGKAIGVFFFVSDNEDHISEVIHCFHYDHTWSNIMSKSPPSGNS